MGCVKSRKQTATNTGIQQTADPLEHAGGVRPGDIVQITQHYCRASMFLRSFPNDEELGIPIRRCLVLVRIGRLRVNRMKSDD